MDISYQSQTIESIFGNTDYYIDFYQRQYKWGTVPVKRLLDDIFYKFESEYSKMKDSSMELKQLIERYGWYYLNTYVTNKVDGKVYIVDGQQRLTTIMLILIKLKHVAEMNGSALYNWIENRIAGQSGFDKSYWMHHDSSEETVQLIDTKGIIKAPCDESMTSRNIVSNYKFISDYFDSVMGSGDINKFETFVFYFLRRIILIRLDVNQADVPMIFEVINDRGIRLRPHEILKAKLLGQIGKEELSIMRFDEIWDNQVHLVDSIDENKQDEIDEFFSDFLRSKYSKTFADRRKFEKDYHRSIMEVEELGLARNETNVKRFILDEFTYYTTLYHKIRTHGKSYRKEYEHLYYNGSITEMKSQYWLIMACCSLNEPLEDEKIKTVTYETDRAFTLLQLQQCYNSNYFQEAMFNISVLLKSCNIEDIRRIFDNAIISTLQEHYKGSDIQSVWNYSLFRNAGYNMDKRFIRYVLARVERYITDNTNQQLKYYFYNLVRISGDVYGFHIEHILAMNDENIAAFGGDEELFMSERNRLGGLLILRNADNIASGNETYSEKLKTFANTLVWNTSLTQDLYHNHLDFNRWVKESDLPFRPLDSFGPNEIEERQRLLFELIAKIWR